MHCRCAAVENRIGREPHCSDSLRRQSDRRKSQRADGGGDCKCDRRRLRGAAIRSAAIGGENLLGSESEELAAKNANKKESEYLPQRRQVAKVGIVVISTAGRNR